MLFFVILALCLLAGVGVFQWFWGRRMLAQMNQAKQNDTSLLLIQQQMEGLREHLRQNLDGSAQSFTQQMGILGQQLQERFHAQGQILQTSQENVGKRLDNAARMVGELQNKLGKLEEASGKIFDVGKDIASLQEILRSPKLRGNLGELFLGDLLTQLLPAEHFHLQYEFKGGEKVDAVVKLGGHFVPIDSKFPLENFKKYVECKTDVEKKAIRKIFLSDVKKHIDAIAQKYIRPDEGTFDFALMYIPAENVYYEMIIREEAFDAEFSVISHAMGKRVIPVSPNNFYVYLNTILLGLKGLKIEQSAKEIQANLSGLRKDVEKFEDDFSKLGKHLGNARSCYEESDKRFVRLKDRIENISVSQAESTEIQPTTLKQIVGGG